MKNSSRYFLFFLLILIGSAATAKGIEAFTITPTEDGGQSYSLTIQVLLFMTLLSVLPAILMMMTSFTRIIIVLGMLRQAMGTASTPSNQVLLGLALFLTFFIMTPVFNKVYDDAINPYLNDEIVAFDAFEKAKKPFRDFMIAQTRDDDIALFANIAGMDSFEAEDEVPFSILMPAFATSELKTAFQIGFILFIPFLIIDMVVASVLMSMGMMMLSPLIVSLPFKIMLFVLIDGWALIMGTLANSFYI